ncbi:hypothetical protein BABINDRAFT_162309 [Babjeviella inositovora NRRL Y-12698]|uniref:Vacuolar-sorting protein SNF7 n=1 Tax=Babjeviella inositovora NRRL Y-12698 TaxID=984486 RepID=A0A1E3QNJ4_9ASCO|nr:uncharacterized protein BABINDRAFT_162309 [Babjeviella inositovora NRRL Y-12698]ODQ79276.1 hypothetical protein BABINDRAFT_162309 [Babjeviella inositovora NRRL Y-12698]
MSSSAVWQSQIDQHPAFTPTRIPSLYSDFTHLKETNPEGYAANLRAWKSLLLGYPKFVFTGGNELLQALVRNGNHPLHVDSALDKSVTENSLVPLSVYERHTSYYDSQKMSVGKLLGWFSLQVGFGVYHSAVKSPSTTSNWLKQDSYINIRKLEGFCADVVLPVVKRHSGTRAWVVQKDVLFEAIEAEMEARTKGERKENRASKLDLRDFGVLLTYLTRDVKVCVRQGTIFKFSERISVSMDLSILVAEEPPLEITEQDVSMLSIRSTLSQLERHQKDLHERILEKETQIKEQLQKKNLPQAKLQLKSKMLLLNSLEKSTASHNQILEVVAKIDESSNNLQVLQALEQSRTVLKELSRQAGSLELIDELMGEISDEVENVNEVSERLAMQELRDVEVDEEFESMVQEEAMKKQRLDKKGVISGQASEVDALLAPLEALEAGKHAPEDDIGKVAEIAN